ncbi:MAG: quinone-dependent dihydroorotate dehydrogenase [Fimbriimonadaceae bacterium]|nr:quinone-dependent dihydroorotate dehydrogenase [Fimbriimonadaceae bacterium]
MGFYHSVLRPLLFMLPAESAHDLGMSVLRRGWVKAREFHHSILEQEFFGVKFPNPLGLAAGFDKHALAVNHWHLLGFGSVEIGTVTWHPQPGNPKPRLFRIPSHQGLINRFGFNNEGARVIASRLAAARPQLPVGVNLGKSKVTELDAAAKDYQDSYRLLHRSGAYFVVNVSSPNTPGLRSLQEKGPLLDILAALREVDGTKPMFVKVAPDLEMDALDDVLDVAREAKLTGIIATNTTLSREMLPANVRFRDEVGGLSGMPVREKANMTLRHLAQNIEKGTVLIGVGGIFDAQDLYDKVALGAHLCQIYTGWVYGGPQFVPNVLEEFVGMLERDGVRSLADLRGVKL